MSYDIELYHPGTRETVEVKEKHQLKGGTYAVGGTNRLELNITYNYSSYFYDVMGKEGIRTIYGMTAYDSIPVLENAIEQLDGDVSDDYWEPSEGNAKKALCDLLTMAKMAPKESIWGGD